MRRKTGPPPVTASLASVLGARPEPGVGARMILIQNFFGSGNYSIVGPYMGELWPSRLRGRVG